jgi:hypothetical protein
MDTAQPAMAAETDPNAQLAQAADAFKAFTTEAPIRPRDEQGRFASDAPEEQEEPAQTNDQADEADYEDEGELEADEAAEEPAQPMPPSWGADDAELWASLPPEAQARIAEREGERDRGINLKLQEAAQTRKAFEARVGEASNRLEELDRVIGVVETLYKRPEPDPRAFGYGTQQFNQAAYQVAYQQWQQDANVIAQLEQQRVAAATEQSKLADETFTAWKQEHEAEYAPKFLADVPDLKDAAKAEPLMRDIVDYAIKSGIPAELFAEENQKNVTSAQLHILWKAQQYDNLRATKAQTAPKPKPAGPVVKPGVSSPRSATKAARRARDFDRLSREGSIDAGAAVFKHLMR